MNRTPGQALGDDSFLTCAFNFTCVTKTGGEAKKRLEDICSIRRKVHVMRADNRIPETSCDGSGEGTAQNNAAVRRENADRNLRGERPGGSAYAQTAEHDSVGCSKAK